MYVALFASSLFPIAKVHYGYYTVAKSGGSFVQLDTTDSGPCTHPYTQRILNERSKQIMKYSSFRSEL